MKRSKKVGDIAAIDFGTITVQGRVTAVVSGGIVILDQYVPGSLSAFAQGRAN